MKLTKTRIVLLTVMVIALAFIVLLPKNVYATAKYGDLEYTLSNGEITINSCDKNATSVTIPEKIVGYTVTKIGYSAFEDCTKLKTVTLNKGLKEMEIYAFKNCTSLTSITFPSTLLEIGSYTFQGCTSLNSVNFGKLQKIGYGAFEGCSSLSNIKFPASVNNIEGYSFGNTALTQVVVPSTVKYFGASVFSGCKSLKSAAINADISLLDDSVFENCSSLVNVTLNDKIEFMEFRIFKGCTSLKEVTLPAKLSYVKNYIFEDCPNLVKVVFPEQTLFSNANRVFGEERNANLKLYVIRGSAAEELAINNGIKFEYYQVDISKCKISGISNKVYTGKNISQTALTVGFLDKKLTKGTDYTVSYSSNKNVGQAKVIIKGIGKYKGSITKIFIIKPKGTSLKKLTSGKKQIKITWNKRVAQTTGYQIQYSTNSKFKSGNKTVKITKTKTTSKTIKKLKAKKKYYVRIRTYKTVNGKTYYSGWSKIKNVTTKK